MLDRIVYGRAHNCKNPVDPTEATGVVNDETHEEGATGRAKCDKKSPHADVSSTLLLEESLGDNTRASATRRTDEECGECSADGHGSVRVTLSTTDVERKGSESADEPDGAATIAIGNRLPE